MFLPKVFPIKNIEFDRLFEEYIIFKQIIPDIQKLTYEQKWLTIFKTFNFPNMLKIVEFIFALPHFNAMSERLFSLMFHSWRSDRSRLLIKSIEAEILVKHNFNKNCKDFYKYVCDSKR